MTRRPLLALVAAGGVTAFLIAVDLVRTLINFLPYALPGLADGFGFGLLSALGQDILVGIGVFLVLWLIIPNTGNWTIRRAIGAGALAAFGGAFLVAVSELLMALWFAREASGSLYDLIPLSVDPIHIVTNSVSLALYLLPLTVLAAILVREWLRSRTAVDAPKEPVAAV